MLHGVLRQLLVGKHYIACRNLLKALGNNEHLRNEFGVLCVLASLPSADSWLHVLHDARQRCDVLPSSSNSATTTTHRRNIARGAVAAGMLHMLKDTAEVGAFLESGLTEAEREAILVVLLSYTKDELLLTSTAVNAIEASRPPRVWRDVTVSWLLYHGLVSQAQALHDECVPCVCVCLSLPYTH